MSICSYAAVPGAKMAKDNEKQPTKDWWQVIKGIAADMGSPIDPVIYIGNVAITKGNKLEDVGYIVVGTNTYNQYFKESEARANLKPGDRLYAITVRRIE